MHVLCWILYLRLLCNFCALVLFALVHWFLKGSKLADVFFILVLNETPETILLFKSIFSAKTWDPFTTPKVHLKLSVSTSQVFPVGFRFQGVKLFRCAKSSCHVLLILFKHWLLGGQQRSVVETF